jgi:hypothetical protein
LFRYPKRKKATIYIPKEREGMSFFGVFVLSY